MQVALPVDPANRAWIATTRSADGATGSVVLSKHRTGSGITPLPVLLQLLLPTGYAASPMIRSTSAAGISRRLPSRTDRISPDLSCE